MAETPECRSARVTLQRAIVGVAVSEEEVRRARAHVASCETCESQLGLARHLEGEPVEPTDADEARVNPEELFERALTAALSDPDKVAPDEAPFIARALARVTGAEMSAGALVIELLGSPGRAGEETTLGGGEGISGTIKKEENDLWLKLNKLPPSFENTKPVVVLPGALTEGDPAIRWSGTEPGLVAATTPVTAGSLEVRLCEIIAPTKEPLFQRVYLLNPEARRRQSS